MWFELLLIPETNDQLGFLNCVTNVTFSRDSGEILTDDVPDLPRSTFLQLGENVGLKCQRCNSEEKLFHVVSYSEEDIKINKDLREN